jgi:hypothetical protein
VPFPNLNGLSSVSAAMFPPNYIGKPPALPDFFNDF